MSAEYMNEHMPASVRGIPAANKRTSVTTARKVFLSLSSWYLAVLVPACWEITRLPPA